MNTASVIIDIQNDYFPQGGETIMPLALLGFAMIVVFMGLIMAKKLSPFTSLILVPIVFGLLAGYGWDTLKYAMDGIKSVASTFAMMTFAILYFGVMLTAGMFRWLTK